MDNILEQLCKGVKTETVFIYIKPITNKDNIIETLSQKLEKYSVKIFEDIKKISLSIIDFEPEKKFICRWKVQNKQGDYSARPVYYIPKLKEDQISAQNQIFVKCDIIGNKHTVNENRQILTVLDR